MLPKPVTNKRQMYELLRRGAFGNHTRLWLDPEEFITSGFTGAVGVRCVGNNPGPFYPHLTPQQALIMCSVAEARGYSPVISEFTPVNNIVLNGELTRNELGLVLLYSRAKTHMRPALRTATHAIGVCALTVLREVLSPPSYADIEALLDLYPGHVIELTVFQGCVGELRGRNHVVWEVRQY